MSSPAETVARLSAVRLVSFIPAERDAVHIGMLSPDATQVIDLAPLGISDAYEALDQLDMLRRAAGAIVHGAARTAFDVRQVHLVAPIPLARSVVLDPVTDELHFADPTTLHGPGSVLSAGQGAAACAGLATVVGTTIEARSDCADTVLDAALIGSLLVLGWPQAGPGGALVLLPGAVGPFVAVPGRRPESLILTRVPPVAQVAAPDRKEMLAAPDMAQFRALARRALASHTLRAGDLLTIFPAAPAEAPGLVPSAGSWVRLSAPGLGTLSLAVQ